MFCILYSVFSVSSCILCPVSFNLYPVSCILYPVPCILYPTYSIFCIFVICILYSVSCILYPVCLQILYSVFSQTPFTLVYIINNLLLTNTGGVLGGPRVGGHSQKIINLFTPPHSLHWCLSFLYLKWTLVKYRLMV